MKSKTINNAALAAALACIAAACSGTLGTGGDSASAPGMAASEHQAVPGADGSPWTANGARLPLAGRPAAASFADLPDRGDLVGYPRERVVRRAGPYTWHRADVSEAHALRAIVDGVLTITAPSGNLLRFAYDRHVEHPSGDWTWIGHAVDGDEADDAIVTFGAGAVFGSIAQPGQPSLKLAMEDGASWLVETDAAALAAQSQASGRYDQPDFLLPPDLAIVEGLRAQGAAVRASDASVATTIVDVVVGYTSGYEAANMAPNDTGPVLSRINFLVDVTNESYVNSQVSARVRLVHAMKVAYPDATDNKDALRALTGSDGTTTPTLSGVDAALRPLHTARDQYGADLISLVRDFQHPEAVSCGVAWLIGGGQSEIHAGYAPYGMSVVSDGADGGFYCEDTTFAHELGHNMGLAHDIDTAKGEDGVLDPDDYGRYPYSFGYRTGTLNGNFYTVMAYNEDQVNHYRVFSNPDITICGGFPCGLAGQADNALTLRATMGIIASFRGTVVVDGMPLPNDFDGDGASDILWRHVGDGRNVIWRSANAATSLAVAQVPSQAWEVVGSGDFNGDGASDILWRNSADGRNVIWRSGDAATPLAVAQVPSQAWQVAGIGDFDGDGTSDILWRNSADGRNVIWHSGSAATALAIATVPSQDWHVVGIGDFDADGESDILWRNVADGRNAIWLSADAGRQQAIATVPKQDWWVEATGDYDADGAWDILWRNRFDGRNTLWRSGNSATPSPVAQVSSQSWTIVP